MTTLNSPYSIVFWYLYHILHHVNSPLLLHTSFSTSLKLLNCTSKHNIPPFVLYRNPPLILSSLLTYDFWGLTGLVPWSYSIFYINHFISCTLTFLLLWKHFSTHIISNSSFRKRLYVKKWTCPNGAKVFMNYLVLHPFQLIQEL